MNNRKKLTIEQFKELLANPNWTHNLHIDKESSININDVLNWNGSVESTHTLGDYYISHYGLFEYEDHEPETFHYVENDGFIRPEWITEGFLVVDENGYECHILHVVDLLPDNFKLTHHFNVENLKISEPVIIGQLDPKFESIKLKWTNKPEIHFNSDSYGGFSTSYQVDKDDNYYSGSFGRWKSMSFYKTKSPDSQYIAEYGQYSNHDHERHNITGIICNTKEEIKDFFKDIDLNIVLRNELFNGIDKMS